MASYSSIVPYLNVAPMPGYRLRQFIPLDLLAAQIHQDSATLDVFRDVYLGGELVDQSKGTLVLENGVWKESDAGAFELHPVEGSDWMSGATLAFLETRTVARDATFSVKIEPGSYVVFSGDGKKSFLSDNSLMFSHPAVIKQVASYGKWAEGYPACVVDPNCDADQSVALINPYKRPAVVTLEFEGRSEKRKIRVAAQSAQRVAFSDILDPAALPWSGQAYVSGPNRLSVLFVNHSLKDPGIVTNLEHSDAFRGASHWYPFTRAMHWKYRTENGMR